MAEEQRLIIRFENPLLIAEVEPPPQGRALLTIAFNRFVITAEGEHVMYTLPIDHRVSMQVTYVDAQGNPARVDGEVVWASSDDTIATVTTDQTDSSICTVTPAGQLGQVQVTATADADLGQGVRSIITTADIEIVAGEAVAGSIQPLGEPQPIPPEG